MDAAAYVRISNDPEGKRAGVKRQREDTAALIASKGWSLVETFEDNDTSAWSGKKRPQYERMLDAIRSGHIQAVCVWHEDRLHRHPRELEDFIDLADRHGIALASCTGDLDLSTEDGRFRARIMGAVAKKESDDKSRRLKRAMEAVAAEGRPHAGGKRPFGYRYDQQAKTYRIVPEEATLIQRIARDLQRGRSFTGIIAQLNADPDTPTMEGGRWRLSNVRNMLLSPVLTGRRTHKRTGTVTPGNWKPILSVEEQERLAAVIRSNGKAKRSGGRGTRPVLLTGILRCSQCPGHDGHGGRLYRARGGYVCQVTAGGCGHLRIMAEATDEYLYEVAVQRTTELDETRPAPKTDAEETALVNERLALLERRDGFAEKLAEGIIDDRAYAAGVRKLDAKIADIDNRLSAVLRASLASAAPRTFGQLAALAGPWKKDAADLTDAEMVERREFIRSVIERVTVKRAVRRGAPWSSSRLEITWKHELAKPKRRSRKAA